MLGLVLAQNEPLGQYFDGIVLGVTLVSCQQDFAKAALANHMQKLKVTRLHTVITQCKY